MTKIKRHTCLGTCDSLEDAKRTRDEYVLWLRLLGLADTYCIGYERRKYAWQVWLYRYIERR